MRHYARGTAGTYIQWERRFLRFHGLRPPREMGQAEINAFLTHLAVEEGVSASSQTQASCELLPTRGGGCCPAPRSAAKPQQGAAVSAGGTELLEKQQIR